MLLITRHQDKVLSDLKKNKDFTWKEMPARDCVLLKPSIYSSHILYPDVIQEISGAYIGLSEDIDIIASYQLICNEFAVIKVQVVTIDYTCDTSTLIEFSDDFSLISQCILTKTKRLSKGVI